MATRITLGGKRLGSGKKMDVTVEGYGRSNHDLSTRKNTTQAPGTLVPIYSRLLTPGATLDIGIRSQIQTNPTLGALYGSYLFGVDMFLIPLRLYIGGLQYNALNMATNMQFMFFPTIEIEALSTVEATDLSQVGSSCVLRYLGIKGIGSMTTGWGSGLGKRKFNAIPAIAYYDTFANYYANTQEDNCYMIHTDAVNNNATAITLTLDGTNISPGISSVSSVIQDTTNGTITFTGNMNINSVYLRVTQGGAYGDPTYQEWVPIRYLYTTVSASSASPITLTGLLADQQVWGYKYDITAQNLTPRLQAFPLQDIKALRPILNSIPAGSVYPIDKTSLYGPWKYLLNSSGNATTLLNTQEGLMVKTYQSDIFNNFIKTATVTAMQTQTAVSTAGNSFNIDSLNMAIKFSNLLQKEVASGGTLTEYVEIAYGVNMYMQSQIPMYIGGYRDEIVFDEVVSNAATTDQPLGQIAGKGRFLGQKRGGNISVKTTEWCYLMGIQHITPRVDYSQGNRWDTSLKTMNDIHKPSLDEIGYQDLITEYQAYWATTVSSTTITQTSMGKQAAWMWYQTDVDETFGLFAEIDNLMFMTLNRRYEKDTNLDTIKDLTTYIDPVKYNYIFADTELSAQNFRIQTGFDINARLVMSAKIIPNL